MSIDGNHYCECGKAMIAEYIGKAGQTQVLSWRCTDLLCKYSHLVKKIQQRKNGKGEEFPPEKE